MNMRTHAWVYPCALALLILHTASATAQSQQAVDRELKQNAWLLDQLKSREESAGDIEERVFNVEEKVGDRALVKAFDAVELDLGGFLTQAFSVVHGENNTEYSPNFTQLELLFRANVADKWSLFSAIGFLREADIDVSDAESPFFRAGANRTPLIISWMNYRHSDALQLRAGRFVAPHGIINIEHFPPSLLDTNQPQFLRPFPGSTIFPNFMNGIQAHGRVFVGQNKSNFIEYSAYGAFHDPAPDKVLTGARVAYGHKDSGVTFGLNYAHGSRESGASPAGSFTAVPVRSSVANRYDTVGGDILIDKGRFLWKTEGFYSFENDEEDRWTFYTQPSVRLHDQWVAFYRYDLLDPGQGLDRSSEHVFGLNYLPFPIVRLRGAVFLRDFDNGRDNVLLSQLSATISF